MSIIHLKISIKVIKTLLKKTVEDALQHSSQCFKNTTWIDPGITGYA